MLRVQNRIGSSTAKTAANRRWRGPLALVSAFAASMLGLGVLGQVMAPEGQAASVQGNASSFNTAGWRFIGGTGTSAGPVLLGATTSSSSASVPFTPIDRDHLYGSTYSNGGTVWYLDNSQPPNGANQVLIGYGKNASNIQSNPLSTIAIDADPYGTGRGKAAYLWGWDSQQGYVDPTENGGPTAPNNTFAMVRWTADSTDGQFILAPNPDFGNFNQQRTGTAYSYWSAGEVIQKNGKVFLGGGECAGINNSYAMMIFDPVTLDYNFSGTLKPKTAADNIFGTGDGCTGNASVKSDFALDANGNAYLLVGSTQAAPTFGLAAASRLWLVRVVPGENGANWTYELVTPIQTAPGQPSRVNTFSNGGSYGYGSAFFNGMLYTAVYQDGDWLAQTNPMSGLAYDAGTFGPVQNYVQDLASGQTAQVLEGTVYNDANANGAIDAGEVGAPNVTVAIYLKATSGANAGKYVLMGVRQTNQSGNYSFLLGGDGDYVVRVAQPQINIGTDAAPQNVNAVQTWASGYNQAIGTASSAMVTATCQKEGNITAAAGGTCTGAIPPPFVDPAVPTDLAQLGTNAATQPDKMAIYSTVSIKGDQVVGEANFGITAAGSFGDSASGPATVAANAPVHNNGLGAPVQLGPTVGKYTGPATDNSHATDDGVFLVTPNGNIPLQGTVLSATKSYQLSADVQAGIDCADPDTPCYISAWTTGAGNNTWSPSPVWPTAGQATKLSAAGPVTGPYQFQTGGTVAINATVQLRASVSTAPQTKADNSLGEYQGTPTGTTPWTSFGEIEDYSFTIGDAVYRPAAVTTSGTISGPVAFNTVPMSGVNNTTTTFWPAVAASSTSATSFSVTPPDNKYSVQRVDIEDTTTGTIVKTLQGSDLTPVGNGVTFSYTFALGQDMTVLATLAPTPTYTKLTTDPDPAATPAGGSIKGIATIQDADHQPIEGALVTFANATPASTSFVGGTNTCETGPDGTCFVQLTSSKAGTYTDELSATVPVNGTATALVDSPKTVTFTPADVDYTKSYFTVAPITDPGNAAMTGWPIADGTAHYTGTFTAEDSFGNLKDGLTLTDIVFSGTSPVVTSPTVTPVGNGTGQYTVTFTSVTAGSDYVASLMYKGAAIHAQTPVTATTLPIPFRSGPFCASKSTFAVQPVPVTSDQKTWVKADGTDHYTGTLMARDCQGNVIPDLDLAKVQFAASSADVVVGSPVVNAGGGAYTAQFTSTVASPDYTAHAGYDGVVAGATTALPSGTVLPIPFRSGPFCGSSSSFVVSPVVDPADATMAGWVVADGQASYTGTLTARDCQGNPITDLDVASVVFVPSSADVAWSQPVVNAGQGAYTTHFSSMVAGAGYTAFAKVGDAVAGATTANPAGDVAPIPFMHGTPVPGDCAPTAPACTNLSVSPGTLPIQNNSTATVLLTDYYGNVVTDAPVTFTVDGSASLLDLATSTAQTQPYVVNTNPNGVAKVYVTDMTVETAHVRATIPYAAAAGATPVATDVHNSPASVSFTHGPVNTTNSTWAVAPVADPTDLANRVNWVPADGTSSYTGTLTALDNGLNPVPDLDTAQIAAAASSRKVHVGDVVNNQDGTYTVHFTSTSWSPDYVAGVAYAGNPVGDDLPIPFTAGQPDPTGTCTHLVVDPPAVLVGGNATATATIMDVNCNPVPKVPVTFTVDGAAVLSDAGGVAHGRSYTVPTDGDGVASLTISDATAQLVNVHAKIGATPTDINDSPAALDFYPGAPVITSPLPKAVLVTHQPTVKGTGTTPGDTITVYDGTVAYCTAQIRPDKTWSCDGGLTRQTMADGPHTLVATETDAAKQVSPRSAAVPVTIVSKAPVITWPKDGTTTSNHTPTISGTGDAAGDAIAVWEGTTMVCSTKITADLSWSCVADPALIDGAHKVVAIETDAIGGTSAPSNQVAFTVGTLRIAVKTPALYAGDPQVVTGYYFDSGDQVTLTIESTPVTIATKPAGLDGTVEFSFNVPSDLPGGEHKAILTGVTSGSVQGTFQVLVEVKTGGSVAPGFPYGLAGGSGVAVLLGLWLGVVRRRDGRLAVAEI